MQKNTKRFVREVRRARHVSAWIVLNGQAHCECQVMDISANGAKVVVALPAELPTKFSLAFLKDRPDRRDCKVVWRRGKMLGVTFVNSH